MYVLLQAVVSELTDCWKDLIIVERCVVVNMLHRPEALFTRARKVFKRNQQYSCKGNIRICFKNVSLSALHF